MARILISSGPTRQYLDPVRYLTNASSGKMGCELTKAALKLGHEVIVVTGPVDIEYPTEAQVIPVVETDEMLAACREAFATCDGMIGAAAPCDYQPVKVADDKIAKTGEPLVIHLIETSDIVATLGGEKRSDQWVVGFALETTDQRFRAITKLEKKSCDLIVLNGPEAIHSNVNRVEVLNRQGDVVKQLNGAKSLVAEGILSLIDSLLIVG